MRHLRKKEHLENYLKTSFSSETLFGDLYLEHQALTELDYEDVDTSLDFLGKKISFPFMINAITGGNDYANHINESLARISRDLSIPMAVGSQKIALEDQAALDSFRLVRRVNPQGLIIANLSALSGLEDARRAVDMIGADALQLHLNIGQELVMKEGDRSFSGVLSNIENIVQGLDRPVIIKEVGMGLGPKVIRQVYDLGVRYVDLAGKGGSNFIEIENLRNPAYDFSELYDWGIPTALSLYQANSLGYEDLNIISSGGIKTATDIAKSIAMGARLCAGSGEVLSYLVHGDYEMAHNYLEGLRRKLRIIMMLVNSKNLEDLSRVEYRISGRLKDLIQG